MHFRRCVNLFWCFDFETIFYLDAFLSLYLFILKCHPFVLLNKFLCFLISGNFALKDFI